MLKNNVNNCLFINIPLNTCRAQPLMFFYNQCTNSIFVSLTPRWLGIMSTCYLLTSRQLILVNKSIPYSLHLFNYKFNFVWKERSVNLLHPLRGRGNCLQHKIKSAHAIARALTSSFFCVAFATCLLKFSTFRRQEKIANANS